MRKRETEQEAIIRRQKQYGCDGHCYGSYFDDDGDRCEWMCGGIDHGCPEHIVSETIATVMVCLSMILIFVIPIIAFVIFLIGKII